MSETDSKKEPERQAAPGQPAPSAAPATDRSGPDTSATDKPDLGKPGNDKSGSEKPGLGKPDTGKPGNDKPALGKPDAGKPGADKPVPGKPDAGKPDADRPGPAQAGQDRPISGKIGPEPGRPSTDGPADPPGPARPASGNGGGSGKGGGKGLAALALLVGLAGLAAGGYSLMQQQRLGEYDEQIGRLQDIPEQARQQNEQLAARLTERDSQLASRLESLEKQPLMGELEEQQRLLSALQSQQQRLSGRVEDVLGESREYWRLAEAEHLLRLAMLRLSAMQDVQSAAALIEEADLILQKQDDPGAYHTRQELLEGLEALRSLPQVDRTGLFLQLGALRGQASQLAALTPEFQPGEGQQPGQAQGGAADQPFWQRWQEKISRYVRVDLDTEKDVQPLLAGQSLNQVRLALSLAIEQAQWAVLNSNGEVYRQSLEQARALLADHFSSENENSQALRERIGTLARRQVEVELPDLTPALRALEAYVEERQQPKNGSGKASSEPTSNGQPTPNEQPPSEPASGGQQQAPTEQAPAEQPEQPQGTEEGIAS